MIDLNRTIYELSTHLFLILLFLFNTMALSYSEDLPFYGLDDDSFNLEILELNTEPVNFNTYTDSLASLSYNPLFANANQHLTKAGFIRRISVASNAIKQ